MNENSEKGTGYLDWMVIRHSANRLLPSVLVPNETSSGGPGPWIFLGSIDCLYCLFREGRVIRPYECSLATQQLARELGNS